MRTRSLVVAALLLAGSISVATAAQVLGNQRRSDAAWLLTRASAQGSNYLQSFDGRNIDAALSTFSDRRAVMGVAVRYDLLRAVGFLGIAASILWLYGLFLASRLVPIGATGTVTASDEAIRAAEAVHAIVAAR